MSQLNSPLAQNYGQNVSDGPIMESPGPLPTRGSSESRQELLRSAPQSHPAPFDFHFESETPVVPPNQVRSSTSTPMRPRRTSQSTPFTPSVHPTPSIEEGPEGQDPRVPHLYQNRNNRRQSRPPASYNNFAERNSRYGPIHRSSGDPHAYPAYADTPAKPNYEMYYPYYQDQYARYPAMWSPGGGRGYPPYPPYPAVDPKPENIIRLPWMIWMGSNAKNHFVAFVGEFVGTTMFLFFAFSGTQVANIRSAAAPQSNTTTNEAAGFSPIVLLYIALVFAFSLMVNVWVFFRISGGLFNPAVTFAMLLCRALSPIRAFLLLAAQISGSIFASFLVKVLFPTSFNVRTTLGEGTSLAQGVMIEAVLTAELVFTIFMLAKEKHKATFIAPVGIGLALFIGELVGVYYTGGSLNPARSFGPCVITGVFDHDHWIYWIGPGVGAILAVIFYQFIKILEYEVANPGQDDDGSDHHTEAKEEFEKREGSQDVEMGYGATPTATPVPVPGQGPVPPPPSVTMPPLSLGSGATGPPSVISGGVARHASKRSVEGQGFGGRGEQSLT